MAQSSQQPITSLLKPLVKQISGIYDYYRLMLDDDFLFASAAQVPQVATIFDATYGKRVEFGGDTLTVPELLALIAHRYGFNNVRRVGYGGYAVVLGHDHEYTPDRQHPIPVRQARHTEWDIRRVLRLVPNHHVPDVIGDPEKPHPYDVHLDENNEPLRDQRYPLILSDLFLLPRHTTQLVFHDATGAIIQAGGYPAILHCQLLPEVIPMNVGRLERQQAEMAGEVLEAALATLGVNVADAHGGNGGVMVGHDGEPLATDLPMGQPAYVPVVLDFGYYSEIGPKKLASILARHGVQPALVGQILHDTPISDTMLNWCLAVLNDEGQSIEARYASIIAGSGLNRQTFGRLLHSVKPPVFRPITWIDRSRRQWRTTKEMSYPPLQDQARLNTLYPAYDEILFPQRIETYHLTLR